MTNVTIPKKVVEQALDALGNARMEYDFHGNPLDACDKGVIDAADALYVALEQSKARTNWTETVRLAEVALHEMPRPRTDWMEAAKAVCESVVKVGHNLEQVWQQGFDHQQKSSCNNGLQRESDQSITGCRSFTTGWKQVPVELTPEMQKAGLEAVKRCLHRSFNGIIQWDYVFRTMLAEAPKLTAQQEDELTYQSGYSYGVVKGREELIAEYPLERDLYDSKDWRCGSYAERVEWLHTMYESAREQIAELEKVQVALCKDGSCFCRWAEEQTQVEQAPLAWMYTVDGEAEPRLHFYEPLEASNVRGITPLYTNPQPPRQPLTCKKVQELVIEFATRSIRNMTRRTPKLTAFSTLRSSELSNVPTTSTTKEKKHD